MGFRYKASSLAVFVFVLVSGCSGSDIEYYQYEPLSPEEQKQVNVYQQCIESLGNSEESEEYCALKSGISITPEQEKKQPTPDETARFNECMEKARVAPDPSAYENAYCWPILGY